MTPLSQIPLYLRQIMSASKEHFVSIYSPHSLFYIIKSTFAHKILKGRNIIPLTGLAIGVIPALPCYTEHREASGSLGKVAWLCHAERSEASQPTKIRGRCSTKSLEQYHLLINQPRALHRTVSIGRSIDGPTSYDFANY